MLAGEGTSGNMVGHIWHFFDQQLNYPVTLIPVDVATRMIGLNLMLLYCQADLMDIRLVMINSLKLGIGFVAVAS